MFIELRLTSRFPLASHQVKCPSAQRSVVNNWGSRGRRFKSGQPDQETGWSRACRCERESSQRTHHAESSSRSRATDALASTVWSAHLQYPRAFGR